MKLCKINIKMIGGDERFKESAFNAIKKMKFKPGKLRGKPVDVIMVLTVQYKLKSLHPEES